MAADPHIVSLWRGAAATTFLCSGVQIAPRYILTVAHAFTALAIGGSAFVCQLRGKHGAVPANLFARHDHLDAALFEIDEPIGSDWLRLPGTIDDYQGRPATLHVIDPHTHHVATLSHASVGSYDGRHMEYVLNPQSALGYSGGLVAVAGQVMALLNRRATDDPIARSIALAKLRPWIAWAIDTPSDGGSHAPDRQAADYDALAGLLGERALQRLANEGTADLRRQGGFPQDAGVLVGRPPRECFQALVVALYQATERCLAAWRARAAPLPRHFKEDCLTLLGELIKLAVDRDGCPPAQLAEIAAATPDRMFVACRRTGTAATVDCALRDIPLRVAARKPGDRDIGGGSVIDLDGLAQGVGPDAERDAYQATWLAVKGAPVPADFGSDEYLDILEDAIDMEYLQTLERA